MASKRKVEKHRKMLVKQTIKEIKKYRFPFDYRYGGGYFIFSFSKSEFNLHVTFRQIPMMKFGIWKVQSYGDQKWYYFAECFPYIDKFKPSRSSFSFESLESMMNWVSQAINNHDFYVSELENMYCVANSDYHPNNFQDIEKDHKADLYRHSHNWFDPEEYEANLKAFNKIIAEADTKNYDIIWTNAYSYKDLYDVWIYCEDTLTDDEIFEFESKLRKCRCFTHQRPLPSDFFKHRNNYCWKIKPGNEQLYFNKKKHYKYF